MLIEIADKYFQSFDWLFARCFFIFCCLVMCFPTDDGTCGYECFFHPDFVVNCYKYNKVRLFIVCFSFNTLFEKRGVVVVGFFAMLVLKLCGCLKSNYPRSFNGQDIGL